MKTVDKFFSEVQETPAYKSSVHVRNDVLPLIGSLRAKESDGDLEALLEGYEQVRQRLIDLLKNPPGPAAFEPAPGPLPEDAKQWCEKLLDDPEHGYASAKDTLDVVLNSAKGETAPNKEKVKAALLKSLTTEQIAELRKLREPTLLIVPDTTAARFQEAVNKPACKTMPGQQDAAFDTFYTNALTAIAASHGVPPNQPKITKYRFVITEGRQHFDAQASDNDFEWNKRENMKNEDRIAMFEAYIKSHPGLVSQNAAMYLMLMLRGLKAGKPTDRINDTNCQFTLLPGEPKAEHVKNGFVARGFWFGVGRRASFGFGILEVGDADARLRAAVMGEVGDGEEEGPDPDVPALDDAVRESFDGMSNAEVLQNFEAQYTQRLVNLKYFGIIPEINNPVITGIDNRQYRAPTFQDIKTKLLKPAFLKKVKRFKKPMLLLTPIGMSLEIIADEVENKRGRLNKRNPVSTSWDLGADQTGELVYFPQRYEPNNDGGITKMELLAQTGGKNIFPGWSVTVIEGTDEIDKEAIKISPPPSDPNASKYKNAHMFAKELKNAGLSGLTPEEWFVLHAEGVSRGKPFESEYRTRMLEVYHRALRAVPSSFFSPVDAVAFVLYSAPEYPDPSLGARRSARE